MILGERPFLTLQASKARFVYFVRELKRRDLALQVLENLIRTHCKLFSKFVLVSCFFFFVVESSTMAHPD